MAKLIGSITGEIECAAASTGVLPIGYIIIFICIHLYVLLVIIGLLNGRA